MTENNTTLIDQLASTHLGRDSLGQKMQGYTTPDEVDPTLLVPVPRVLNRTAYHIDEDNLPFVGFDTWNAYEFSTRAPNGFPLSGVLKIRYPANSKFIVESKSLKLYLNSFNMATLAFSDESPLRTCAQLISDELSSLLETNVECVIHTAKSASTRNAMMEFDDLAELVDVTAMSFDTYNESKDILELDEEEGNHSASVRSDALRSNCRVTNQPDWGDIYVHYKGSKKLNNESLLQYIVSMRKENHFHEEICELVYKRLFDVLNPDDLFVACLYTRRGGIDINPVRASSDELYKHCVNIGNVYQLSEKTTRQ